MASTYGIEKKIKEYKKLISFAFYNKRQEWGRAKCPKCSGHGKYM